VGALGWKYEIAHRAEFAGIARSGRADARKAWRPGIRYGEAANRFIGKIRPPRYPFQVDKVAAKRGAPLFEANCNSCHGGAESDKRLYSVAEIGTDPHRAEMFTQKLADGFNKFLAELETEGYQSPKEFGVRSTGKYFAPSLSGVWARSPYLHNGSVRTMEELLTSPSQRAQTFHRGSRDYHPAEMGYTDAGAYVFDTSASGNSNAGHDYGTALSTEEKRELIEYLKTL
jgi:hypothetical protein